MHPIPPLLLRPSSALALAAIAGLFITPQVRADSRYTEDATSIDFSGIGPNGGTLIVPMVLYSGDPIPGLGTSFNVTYTISAITSFFSPPGTMTWVNTPPTGVDQLGLLYPTNLFVDLPSTNTQALPLVINGVNVDEDTYGWYTEALNEGLLQYTGSFTVTASMPEVPEGYDLTLNFIGYGSWLNIARTSEEVVAGYYSMFDEMYSSFGETVTYHFLGHSIGDPFLPGDDQPVWFAISELRYDAIPEPSSLALLLGGAVALGRWRRARAASA